MNQHPTFNIQHPSLRHSVIPHSSFIIHQSSFSSPSFTLIELMVVIAVIVILLSITLPVAQYVTGRAKETKDAMAKEKIINGLEEYRAVFGEYPIPGDTRHYSTYYVTDTNDPPYSPITWVNLCTTSDVPHITIEGTTLVVKHPDAGVVQPQFNPPYDVDYRLTYPLMLGQLERGEAPFVEFPLVTVCYLVYRRQWRDSQDDFKQHYKDVRLKNDPSKIVPLPYYKGMQGNAINRYKAVSPNGQQWWYESDGMTYTLSPTRP